ncbi:MAG: LON peptidase substrate-binding domain-containing protein [Hyphomicrobium sp.]|nr:LON peptidase substrate-binding domain-containing protein [Hyphomicrobium sp.]
MGWTDQYQRPQDLPPRLPVFPLRGAILLPRATLPLNIFEPRYLAMLHDTLAGSRLIGIIQPARTGSVLETESPQGKSSPLRSVGCAGRVTSYQELDDGRLAITLTGIGRFEVIGEAASPTAYRIASVSYDRFVQDLTQGLGENEVDRAGLLRVLKSYLEQNRLEADWTSIERASSESLVNALSIMAPYGAEEKQALLEARDLKTRSEVLVALAEMEIAANGGSGGTIQ